MKKSQSTKRSLWASLRSSSSTSNLQVSKQNSKDTLTKQEQQQQQPTSKFSLLSRSSTRSKLSVNSSPQPPSSTTPHSNRHSTQLESKSNTNKTSHSNQKKIVNKRHSMILLNTNNHLDQINELSPSSSLTTTPTLATFQLKTPVISPSSQSDDILLNLDLGSIKDDNDDKDLHIDADNDDTDNADLTMDSDMVLETLHSTSQIPDPTKLLSAAFDDYEIALQALSIDQTPSSQSTAAAETIPAATTAATLNNNNSNTPKLKRSIKFKTKSKLIDILSPSSPSNIPRTANSSKKTLDPDHISNASPLASSRSGSKPVAQGQQQGQQQQPLPQHPIGVSKQTAFLSESLSSDDEDLIHAISVKENHRFILIGSDLIYNSNSSNPLSKRSSSSLLQTTNVINKATSLESLLATNSSSSSIENHVNYSSTSKPPKSETKDSSFAVDHSVDNDEVTVVVNMKDSLFNDDLGDIFSDTSFDSDNDTDTIHDVNVSNHIPFDKQGKNKNDINNDHQHQHNSHKRNNTILKQTKKVQRTSLYFD